MIFSASHRQGQGQGLTYNDVLAAVEARGPPLGEQAALDRNLLVLKSGVYI